MYFHNKHLVVMLFLIFSYYRCPIQWTSLCLYLCIFIQLGLIPIGRTSNLKYMHFSLLLISPDFSLKQSWENDFSHELIRSFFFNFIKSNTIALPFQSCYFITRKIPHWIQKKEVWYEERKLCIYIFVTLASLNFHICKQSR